MTWIPLARALLCLNLDCSAIWAHNTSKGFQAACPACGGHSWQRLSVWLDRTREQEEESQRYRRHRWAR